MESRNASTSYAVKLARYLIQESVGHASAPRSGALLRQPLNATHVMRGYEKGTLDTSAIVKARQGK